MSIAWRAPSIDDQVAATLATEAKLRPLTARVLVGRGIVRADAVSKFLEPRLSDLRRPDGMADLPRAVDRLVAALGAGETIGVFGDYDVDGVTTAATLASALRAFGGKVIARAASRQRRVRPGRRRRGALRRRGLRGARHRRLRHQRSRGADGRRARAASTSSSSTITSCRPARRRPTRSSIRAAPTTPFPSRGSPPAGSPSTWRRPCAPASAPPSIRASCSIWWRWERSPTSCRSPTRIGSWSPPGSRSSRRGSARASPRWPSAPSSPTGQSPLTRRPFG